MGHNGIRFGEGLNVFPVYPPKDAGGLTTNSLWVDLSDASWCTFLVDLGNQTSDATDTLTFTVLTSTDGSTTGNQAAFWYRLSSATATNGWGAITAGSSDGVAIANADAMDNMSILIDVDPAIVAASITGGRWVAIGFAIIGPIALMGIDAFVEHKYLGNTMSSS